VAYVHVLDALGAPTRRSIFERLRRGARSVTELAGELPVSRPAVSQHLRVPDGLGEVRDYFDDVWTDVLAAFKSAVEREEGES
jgi:DNA-binding transcriptional ArsR family regulator